MRSFLLVVVVLLSYHVSADISSLSSCRPPRSSAPNCPFSAAQWDSYWREWTCPSTCADGSTPNCPIEPCSTARCAGACVNNYCPNHPVKGSTRCSASCVQPVNCIKDPCQVEPWQPSLCPRGKLCQADYSLGCGFTCEPVTCTWHDEIYQIHDSRPDDDGCNTCSCKPDSTWVCSKKPCRIPTTATPTTAPTLPPSVTCTFNNRTYQINETRPKGDECNICSCKPTGEWICTLRPCMLRTTAPPTTATPTSRVPPIPAPYCPFGDAKLNVAANLWECPSTCSDGSPPVCPTRPCSLVSCGPDQVCVDNMCPGYPVAAGGRCTAQCVKPRTDCVRAGGRTPCDMQFDLRPFCPLPGTTCANDYSVGCNYKCVQVA